VALAALAGELGRLLADVQRALFASALDEQVRRTARPESYDEMIAYLREAGGFARAAWCGDAECEARVKRESSATIRVLPLDERPAASDRCICCGGAAASVAVWAQAY
jgi:prolyl-tRNA synthetase